MLNEDCWKGYKQVGMKTKNGKEVPNCVPESVMEIEEDLRKWFGKGKTGGWDRYNTKGEKVGKCGDAKEGEPYVACLSNEKAAKLGKAGRAAFVKRKRAAQKKAGDAKKGGEQKKGQKPTFVKTGVSEDWSEKYKDSIDCNNPKGFSQRAHCDGKKKNENMKLTLENKLNLFLEKNIPTDPEKWSYAKAQAKEKFDVYPCVPMDSLAVTKQGLKSYDELVIGEDILSYNMQTEKLEWTPIKNLHYFQNADLMEIKKSTGFKFRCTPNHKWVIKRDESRTPELIEAKDITTHMRLVFSANMNESVSKSNLLNENWGKHDTWIEKIVEMTPSEREIWLSSAIVYDGWEKGKSTKIEGRRTFGFSQKNRDHLLSTIYAAYLNGYYVSVNDFDSDVVGVTIIRGKQTHGTQNVIKTFLEQKEDVWCPETENQTWIMVQNGWFTITGNSAYANGWAAKKYKELGGGWKKDESVKEVVESKPIHKSASGEWVAFLSTNKGKKLLKTFNTARGAKTWLSKNVDKLLNTPNTVSVGAMTKQQWDEREAKWAIESVNEDCECGNTKSTNSYSLKEFMIKEGDYKFGEVEYTANNMTPTTIQDLAFAYHQAPIGKLAGRSIDHRIRTARDLGRLVGKNPMNPTEKSNQPALLLHLHKNKLVNVEEYKELYNGLTDKLKKISKYVKNADPASRKDAAVAKMVAKADMREAKKYSIGSGYLGNGLTIWNRAEEKNGDYKTIAHISKGGELKIYDKQLPSDIRDMFQRWADTIKKGGRPELY